MSRHNITIPTALWDDARDHARSKGFLSLSAWIRELMEREMAPDSMVTARAAARDLLAEWLPTRTIPAVRGGVVTYRYGRPLSLVSGAVEQEGVYVPAVAVVWLDEAPVWLTKREQLVEWWEEQKPGSDYASLSQRHALTHLFDDLNRSTP